MVIKVKSKTKTRNSYWVAKAISKERGNVTIDRACENEVIV